MTVKSPAVMLSLSLLLTTPLATFAAIDSTPPDFGPAVRIFDPLTPDLQKQLDTIYKHQETNQFGTQRYALLFKPGKYNLDAQAGFYMQFAGLGQSPDDVTITGAVRTTAGWMRGNATCNFWRSVENLSIVPKGRRNNGPAVWAVSQGTWLRRLHVQGDMNLWDSGWSSGGFLADCKFDGRVLPGSQQQWISRNATWGRWDGGVWNMVFVGVDAPPHGDWPGRPYTVVEKTPQIAEKPYLYINSSGEYAVMVPNLSGDSVGISWGGERAHRKSIPFADFFIVHPDKDSAESINAALAGGKNLILTPGLYPLQSSIKITRADTIVLGLGYPTLIPQTAAPAVIISDVDGVKLGGIIFDAGTVETPALLQVGEPGSNANHAANPTCLYDLIARAGGMSPGKTSSFVTINSNNVIGDNGWFWRADHGNGAGWNSNPVKNGLVVNGNDATFYGLFVEHCQEYQTLWNGNGGRTYFYQSEMPYDPPNQQAWSHDKTNGYASYKVADTVTTHQAFGLGIYSYFTDAPVVADNAIETPAASGVKIRNMVTIRLGGKPGSEISHVINGRGNSETSVKPVRLSE